MFCWWVGETNNFLFPRPNSPSGRWTLFSCCVDVLYLYFSLCLGIKVLHYLWFGVSTSCLVINICLLVCLIKEFFKGITIWVIWNGFILVIRFTIFVLILVLNVNKRPVPGNISFHVLAFFVTIYSILIFLSYYQQVTLTSFGYFKRYRYPARRFPLKIKDEDYLEVEDEEEKRFIEEEFV